MGEVDRGGGQPLGPSNFSNILFLPTQRLNYRTLKDLHRESVGAFFQSLAMYWYYCACTSPDNKQQKQHQLVILIACIRMHVYVCILLVG